MTAVCIELEIFSLFKTLPPKALQRLYILALGYGFQAINFEVALKEKFWLIKLNVASCVEGIGLPVWINII